MARDLKKLFEEERQDSNAKMPEGHEKRFLKKLEGSSALENESASRFAWWQLAASVAVFIGLGLITFNLFNKPEEVDNQVVNTEKPSKNEQLKTLGDVSPGLKKIEDYYLANINLELSKVKLNENNKELFDSYVVRLAELNKEYKKLSVELTENGPNELTISALIDNLKLRLNLLYRLKLKLSELKADDDLPVGV